MLSVRGLTKNYSGRLVVDSVSFDLRPGTVTAFLGPNGAGKSTTLRMITGLTPPSGGGSWIAGRPFRDWPNPGHVAGVLLDASAVHPGRSGLAHLRNAAALMGVPADRARQLLAQLGLADAAGRKVGGYSLGMRQRLGLAHALLADPPLLMLDEPINGLDPVGIRAVRELLRGHAGRGGTVLLSSHVLSEVDQTADRIVMIGGGRVVADGPIRELLASHRSLVRGPDMGAIANALMRAGVRVQPGPDGQILADAPSDRVSDVVYAAGVRVHGISDHQQDLEELFFRLAGDPR
ncbi:ABC transporter ATP-binding protein [Pseudonocardia lacus]|uniref:ABC transporter ATP-binding protein n=1 Tax=Pseudonocardia lacus TaxID=2835865 RepID=UPI001BDD8074|nr:ATP-binding cassette domain-containing protein [Pseudonocardia lacus]